KVRLLNRLPTLDLGGGDYSSCPKGDLYPGPEELSGGRGKQSFDHAASFLSHDGTTAEANRPASGRRPRPECRHSCRRLCDCRSVSARQSNCEFTELADLAVDTDRAAVLLGDDVPGNRQAEPGALAGRLCRDKGLEQFVPNLRCDAGAVVAHPHLDRVADIARRHL